MQKNEPQKHRHESEESDNCDVQACQTQWGQRPLEKNKYQRLNRYQKQQNHNINEKYITFINEINQKDIMSEFRTQQQQQR